MRYLIYEKYAYIIRIIIKLDDNCISVYIHVFFSCLKQQTNSVRIHFGSYIFKSGLSPRVTNYKEFTNHIVRFPFRRIERTRH